MATGFELYKTFKGNAKPLGEQFFEAMIRAASVGKELESNAHLERGILFHLRKVGQDTFVGWKYDDGSVWCCFPVVDGEFLLIDLTAGNYSKTAFPDADFQEPINASLISIVIPSLGGASVVVSEEKEDFAVASVSSVKQPKQKRIKKDTTDQVVEVK